MEEFRGLLNLEVPERKLISFVFFGLPDIEQNLRLDPPLAQRVAMRYRLEPFTLASTEAYVRHRIQTAGGSRLPFTEEAMAALHRLSGGSPRVINTLGDNALFEAYLARETVVDAVRIEEIARSLSIGPSVPEPKASRVPPAPGRTGERVDLAEIDRYLDDLEA
jgi:general secretion pathway protein A